MEDLTTRLDISGREGYLQVNKEEGITSINLNNSNAEIGLHDCSQEENIAKHLEDIATNGIELSTANSIRQDPLYEVLTNQDPLYEVLTNQDPLAGAHINQDALDDNHINQDPLDDNHINQDPLDDNHINQDPLDDNHINQDPLDDNHINQDPLDDNHINQDPLDDNHINQDPLDDNHINQDPLDDNHINQDPLDDNHINQDPLDDNHINQDPLDDNHINQDPLYDNHINQDPLYDNHINQDPLDDNHINHDPLNGDLTNQDSLNDSLVNQDVEETVGESEHLLPDKKEASLPREDRSPGLHAIEQSANRVSKPGEEVPMLNDQKQGGNGGSFKGSESDIPLGFEAVLSELGSPGRFVVFQVLLNLLSLYCISNTALIYVFIGFEPPHSCKQLANESDLLSQFQLVNSSTHQVNYGICDIAVISNKSGSLETVAAFPCLEGHDYRGDKHTSFVSEWDLVCGNVGLKELVQTLLMIGQAIGGIIFTSIADRYGRKPILLLNNLLLGAVCIGAAYSPNIYVLVFFRFFCGLFQSGTALVSYTLMMEFLTAKHRQVAAVVAGINWNISVMMLGGLAYFMQDESWRHLQLTVALFAANVIMYPMFLTESPCWLIANNRHKEALEIIKKACRSGGKDYEKVKAVFERNVIQQSNTQVETGVKPAEDSEVERYNLLDLVRHKSLLVMVLILWFIWVTNSTTYYGLFLASSSLAGNRHQNFMFMALVDLPGDFLSLLLFAYFGRKTVLIGYLLLAGSGLFTATMLMAFGTSSLTATLTKVFSLVGKLGIGSCFNGLFMYAPELFPTNLRSAGLGICSAVSRLGGTLSPYAQLLAEVVIWGPGILFSSMCFLSAIMFMKLPETKGRPMPNTIKEMKQRVTGQSKHKTNQENGHLEQNLIPKEANPAV